jgi:AraC-like DNA-binding protein
MRLSGAEPALGDLLARQANAMLESLPRNDGVSSSVRNLLGGGVDLRSASAAQVARRLGMSVRTLARKLEEDGTSYRDLIDDVRKQTALRELTHGTLPIVAIADRLGFASSQSFHRAFKRWTGTTADRVRKNARPRRS